MIKWCGAKHLLSQRGATSSWKAVAYVDVGQSSIGPHTPLSGGHFVRQGWSVGKVQSGLELTGPSLTEG